MKDPFVLIQLRIKSVIFFFCIPSYISGVHNFGWDFYICGPFFNPTIEVVTFHLHGWCMLRVFLLPAFTHLGHECQDLLSLWWNASMHILDLGLYFHLQKFWGNGVRTHVNSKGKNLYWMLRGGLNPALHHAGQQAQHTTDYSHGRYEEFEWNVLH